jgi:Smg protein
MKDSLFELLLNLFEKTITQLKKQQETSDKIIDGDAVLNQNVALSADEPRVLTIQVQQFQSPKNNSTRVFTLHEQIKLTKASQQFLVRMVSWGVITSEIFELIINRLLFSDSRLVSLDETKWMIRNTLAGSLSSDQLAFLDLVLYHREDQTQAH